MVNQCNNMSTPDDINSDHPENTVSPKYYDFEELHLFHINACSLSKNFDDLQLCQL